MADPWISVPSIGLRVGPMTLTDEQRKLADQAYAKQKAMYQRDLLEKQKDFQQSVAGTGIKAATGATAPEVDATAPPPSEGTSPYASQPFVNPFAGIGSTLGRIFPQTANVLSGLPPDGVAPASAEPAPTTPAPAPDATVYPTDPGIIAASYGGAAQADPAVAAAAPAAAEDPYQKAIDTLSKYFGDPDLANPKQDKADAYAERDKNRTALLAQLAFAAGLTKSGGAGWEGIAQGFGDAAGVYDKGFQRYQSALQDSADRYAKNSDQKANRKLQITKAGIDLAQSQAEMERKTWADRMDSIDKMFGSELTAIKGDLGADPNAVADAMKRWQLARNHGEYIPPTVDVSDK